MKIIQCDFCGKELDVYDTQENFGFHHHHIGYGSQFDGESIDIDLCCDCFDKMMDEYVQPKLDKYKNSLTTPLNNEDEFLMPEYIIEE